MEYVAIAIAIVAIIISMTVATKDRRARRVPAEYFASFELSGKKPPRYREIERRKEDLIASLRFVLADRYSAHAEDVKAIMVHLSDFHNTWFALRAVERHLGTPVFDQVLLYHVENRTSLMHHAGTLKAMPSLIDLD